MSNTTLITSVALQALLHRAIHIALRTPAPDLPHIINNNICSCYATPAFEDLPPFTQELVLTWISERVTVRLAQFLLSLQCSANHRALFRISFGTIKNCSDAGDAMLR